MAGDGVFIAEPFSGSGTTIIACEQLGRKCRAIEISPAYVAVAIQRWVDATGKEPRKPILADKELAKRVSSHEIPGLDLIDAIENNRVPLCDAAQGRQLMEMISAIFQSHIRNGERVAFPLVKRENPLAVW